MLTSNIELIIFKHILSFAFLKISWENAIIWYNTWIIKIHAKLVNMFKYHDFILYFSVLLMINLSLM